MRCTPHPRHVQASHNSAEAKLTELQYTCFDESFLCPIINGDRTLRCGDACYSTTQYTCSNNSLQQKPQEGSGTTEVCGGQLFFPSKYVCYDGNFLCPIANGVATLRCEDACYDPDVYTCTGGNLALAPRA
ncbi:carbohydrate binding-domain-containing protein [Mycena pura]|uniref:Carbohydrate binding-domain-containing protein n=1 Tax=Mycena pura TaxID=153505 RepID=A0AAD6UT27_9AGAR|nr:carbohydrate binding-domain-containing protein [Mycena pura]